LWGEASDFLELLVTFCFKTKGKYQLIKELHYNLTRTEFNKRSNMKKVLILIYMVVFTTHNYGQTTNNSVFEKGQGFYIASDIGLLAGSNNMELKTPISYNISANYLYKGFSVGVVTGLEFYNATFVPAMLDLRYYFLNTDEGIFTYFQYGQSIPLEKKVKISSWEEYNFEGGYIINPGIGYKFKSWGKTSFIVSAGYRIQKYSRKPTNNSWGNVEIIERYNRLNARVGFIF
jgi:hypothetical protein